MGTSPYYADDWLTVLHGDVRDKLRELPDESVHTVVTSPPYWGLRDYGTATWTGGEDGCEHPQPPTQPRNGRPLGAFHGGSDEGNASREPDRRRVCHACGATRIDSQLGLEPTPEQYVENMVAVFREVRRVLRSDGTVWLNLGDSYASSGISGTQSETANLARHGENGHNPKMAEQVFGRAPTPAGLKPKDLVGIPWRVAFALQADGWYLRSDIIWSKPNPMPESVTDRPTKSHEYLFLLAKSPRYFFDADAVREDGAGRTDVGRMTSPARLNQGGPWTATEKPEAGRNIRTVWTVATQPYPGAHFATFPPKLIEPCIKAGTSERGVCPECGKPWRRVVEKGAKFDPTVYSHRFTGDDPDATLRNDVGGTVDVSNGQEWARWKAEHPDRTLSWIPSCAHAEPDGSYVNDDGETVPTWSSAIPTAPAVVLDCFAGSGTTGMVAQSLSRRAILIDLNVDYLGQLMDRNRDIPLGLDVA